LVSNIRKKFIFLLFNIQSDISVRPLAGVLETIFRCDAPTL